MSNIYRYILSTLFAVTALSYAQATLASEYIDVNVRVETPDGTFYDNTVYTNGCTVTDSTNQEHVFTTPNALCALEAAAQTEDFVYEVQDSGFGLFLNSIDEYSSDTNYWTYYVNYQSPSVGISDYDLSEGDNVVFTFGSWPNTSPLKLVVRKKQIRPGQTIKARVKLYNDATQIFEPVANIPVVFGQTSVNTNDNGVAQYTYTGDRTKPLTVVAQADTYTRSNSVDVAVIPKHTTTAILSEADREAMVTKGLDYLVSQMNTDTGVISESQAITEWSALAFAANHMSNDRLNTAVLNYKPTANDGTTEIARHILALDALGIDPRNANGADYVKRLKNTMSNNQFGSEAFVNDDIFAGLALLTVEEPYDSVALRAALEASLAGRNNDGGVSYSVDADISDMDTTGYFVQFLAAVQGHEAATEITTRKALRQAVRYIQRQQNLDGGWAYQRPTYGAVSNSSTTAVVLQSIAARGRDPQIIRRNFRNGANFLQSVQRKNGAFQYDTYDTQSVEALNTAYAIPALLNVGLPLE